MHKNATQLLDTSGLYIRRAAQHLEPLSREVTDRIAVCLI